MDAKRCEADICLRPASMDDLDALVELEQQCFDSDRISRRQFRYLLTKGKASILVAEQQGRLLGDVVLLFSQATSVARLYSIAVAPQARGQGIGGRLMKAAEAEAWEHHRAYLRLEVRKDNRAAVGLYESLGYRRLGEFVDYYEDHADAWRMEKSLAPDLHPELAPVPYYEQSLEFTCGAAALMMAMKTLQPAMKMTRKLELRLWREATTIFMTSGHGGCGPYGLALAAASRGFGVEVYVNEQGTHLGDSVRSTQKKEVMQLVQQDMHEQLLSRGVPILPSDMTVTQIEDCLQRGGIPLVLISSWQIYKARVPHWVVVTGSDDNFIYVNDPYIDHDEGETLIDSIHMPILKDKFESMARYGRVGLQAMVVLYPDTTMKTGNKTDA
ncbi:MAG: GNAT family N-acetyltransferase/peptidase C39 family protein [Chromatiales bacterium]|jgi:ribosomal protein S18 acetylase RimI-like enzyme